jgi:hypothetical protein
MLDVVAQKFSNFFYSFCSSLSIGAFKTMIAVDPTIIMVLNGKNFLTDMAEETIKKV